MPTTRERVVALVRDEPHLNQTEIAERIGISRQRVAQIVADEELDVPRGPRGVASRKRAAAATPALAERPDDAIPQYLAGAGGTIAVLIAAADLMARGFSVFYPLTQSAPCDLVAIDRNGKVERIDVTKARRAGGEIRYDDPDRSKADRRALILTDEPVRYEPALRGYR